MVRSVFQPQRPRLKRGSEASDKHLFDLLSTKVDSAFPRYAIGKISTSLWISVPSSGGEVSDSTETGSGSDYHGLQWAARLVKGIRFFWYTLLAY